MHRLCTLLGMPQHRFASIHVVGTNGKTSVTRMTAALLEAHGVSDRRIPLAAHPLLARADRDRRRADLGGGVRRGAGARGAVGRGRGPERGEEGPVTQYELLTAAAFVAFASARVQMAVIEAGLGGRLDASNVIPSKATVLTSVGLDHTEWLGRHAGGDRDREAGRAARPHDADHRRAGPARWSRWSTRCSSPATPKRAGRRRLPPDGYPERNFALAAGGRRRGPGPRARCRSRARRAGTTLEPGARAGDRAATRP